jgi:hypothetical protein
VIRTRRFTLECPHCGMKDWSTFSQSEQYRRDLQAFTDRHRVCEHAKKISPVIGRLGLEFWEQVELADVIIAFASGGMGEQRFVQHVTEHRAERSRRLEALYSGEQA